MDLAPSSRQFGPLLCGGMDDDCHAENTKITLTPPSGSPVYKPTPPPPPPPPPPGTILPPAGVDEADRLGQQHDVAASGRTHDRPAQPHDQFETVEHGDWKIKITGIDVGRPNPWLCGAQRPQHGRADGRQAFVLCRPAVGTSRIRPRPVANMPTENSTKSGSLIDRFGTLNGIATARHARVHVAGGFVIANQRKSAYSSAGPARPAPRSASVPDCRAALRRVLRSRRHTRRRQQERQRVSPDRHQHRCSATGAARCGSPDPGSARRPGHGELSNTNEVAAI